MLKVETNETNCGFEDAPLRKLSLVAARLVVAFCLSLLHYSCNSL